jgi:hypothetical protein
MAELFKFRCYQCQKLIGAPASKFGKVVKCPRCEVELIVPSPEGSEPDPEVEDPDAFRPEAFGIKLETERLTEPKPTPVTSVLEPVGADPIAFLKQVADEPTPSNPEDSGQSGNEPPHNEAEESDLFPEAQPEPLVKRGRGRGRVTSLESLPRSRDVVFPRTAAVAWSLFGILGLAFAFASGLLAGHFLWK